MDCFPKRPAGPSHGPPEAHDPRCRRRCGLGGGLGGGPGMAGVVDRREVVPHVGEGLEPELRGGSKGPLVKDPLVKDPLETGRR